MPRPSRTWDFRVGGHLVQVGRVYHVWEAQMVYQFSRPEGTLFWVAVDDMDLVRAFARILETEESRGSNDG